MPKSLTLSLLRHAKSSWDHPDLRDRDRPLNARGREAAPAMAAWMAANAIVPAVVLCSTAVRTRQTAALIRPALRPRPELHDREDLYLAEAEDILAIVNSTADAISHLMIIGHNPGLEDLARDLAGSGKRDALTRLGIKFPTCGLAVLSFDTDQWSKVQVRSGRLAHFMAPRYLDD